MRGKRTNNVQNEMREMKRHQEHGGKVHSAKKILLPSLARKGKKMQGHGFRIYSQYIFFVVRHLE
jgi:hypothetical protein